MLKLYHGDKMINKIKENKYQLLELIIIFIITLLFNLVCNQFNLDELWNYGFSYNISNGLIPYKDFNMIITPLFPLLGALFLTIFGKTLLVFHMFNALVCTAIFYFMKKFIPKNYYVAYPILLCFSFPNYNVFCILLLYILMYLENKKSNDYLIGIFLGLTFITKQNIGIYLCIPTLFTKDIKKMIKRAIGFTIPILLLLVYLLINNNLYEFIDYAFLGVSSFAQKNTMISTTNIIVISITSLYLIYQYIKTKDITIIYLLSFQLLVFPLVETYHFMIALIPIIGYIVNKIKIYVKRIFIYIGFAAFLVIIFTGNIVKINKGEYTLPNTTTVYKYRRLNKYEDIAIKDVINYMKNYEGKLYIISKSAYTFKLEGNMPINKYDLLNNGNLGSGGHKKIIKEIEEYCKKEKCVFFVTEEELNDENEGVYNKEIVKYVMETYKRNTKVNGFGIYTNY